MKSMQIVMHQKIQKFDLCVIFFRNLFRGSWGREVQFVLKDPDKCSKWHESVPPSNQSGKLFLFRHCPLRLSCGSTQWHTCLPNFVWRGNRGFGGWILKKLQTHGKGHNDPKTRYIFSFFFLCLIILDLSSTYLIQMISSLESFVEGWNDHDQSQVKLVSGVEFSKELQNREKGPQSPKNFNQTNFFYSDFLVGQLINAMPTKFTIHKCIWFRRLNFQRIAEPWKGLQGPQNAHLKPKYRTFFVSSGIVLSRAGR